MNGAANNTIKRGSDRPKSIPSEHFETILQLYNSGHGYRRIANHLRDQGVSTTFSAVRRFIKGEGAYGNSPTQLPADCDLDDNPAGRDPLGTLAGKGLEYRPS